MQRLRIEVNPDANDLEHWGHSFANLAELFVPCLDAAGARSVVEIGAYAGDLTRLLVDWAATADAQVVAVDPLPQPELVELDQQRDDLTLVRETSLEALGRIEPPDAIIIDGDHNYYTVSEELRLIGDRAAGGELPLLLFHDVGWPHARRDAYYVPELIPESERQPLQEGGGLFPGVRGTVPGALPYKWIAAEEGGERNGVLTAIEDWVAGREGVRLVIVNAFFGFGALWPTSAPWSDTLAAILDPWDRNPLVERLEENRVFHLASRHVNRAQLWNQKEANLRKDALLKRLIDSKSFALACRLSRLWRRGAPSFSDDELRRALGD
jgi:methyltransferase family protein